MQSSPAHPVASPSGLPTSDFRPPTSLLRLLTCGSVDDGKSTLIGRLLYDSRAVFADQIAAIEAATRRRGGGVDGGGGGAPGAAASSSGGAAHPPIDLSLFTDGLRWEREQGITIDVAYRSFSTAARRFILIDCPGHAQYTRNMVTGASNADLAVILVDARLGVQEQTHRHAYLAALLGIRELIVAVNKMDLVDWREDAFTAVRGAVESFRRELHGANITYIPVSALGGDNVVHRSTNTPWHTGPALLELLEAVRVHTDDSDLPARFPVQYVIRPRGLAGDANSEHHDFRGYAGQLASGTLAVGDTVQAMMSGRASTIDSIRILDKNLHTCTAGQSVVLTLADDIDIGRGDLLAPPAAAPLAARQIGATLIWMSGAPMQPGKRYLLRHTTQHVPALINTVETILNIKTFVHERADSSQVPTLRTNDIATVHLRVAEPLFADLYEDNRATGCFVLIDEPTGDTVAAGLIRSLG